MGVRDDIMAAKNPFVGDHLIPVWEYSQEKLADVAEASEKAQQAKLNALIAELRDIERRCTCDGDKLFDTLAKYEEKP